MAMVKLSSKGQVVIPKAIREKLGLAPRKPLLLELVGDHAEIRPAPDVKKELKGSLTGKPSMTKTLVQEHSREVKRDELIRS